MDEIDEVLNIQQRQARKMIMRRYQNKIERAKELAQKKMAPDKNIKKRAYAEARQIVRKRFAGKKGAEYEKLGPSEKISIDRAIEKKQALIKRIALRLIPRVKAAEQKRLQSFVKGHALMNTGAPEGHAKVNESFIAFAEKFDTESEKAKLDTGPDEGKTKTVKSKSKNPEIKYYNKFGEQTIDALDRKAEKSGIDVEVLGEVYNRGLDAWNDHPKVTREQYAFARVNSFINKGKSYYAEDADLVEETIDEKRGLWDNIHAKRKRIKAGSGERMRKPGSKGAPSAEDLKSAQESVEIDELSTPTLHSYLDKAKKTTPFSKQRKPYGSDPVKHKEDERRREQRNSYMKTAVKKISAKYAAEEVEVFEEKEIPLSHRNKREVSHYRVLNNGKDVTRHDTYEDAKTYAALHRAKLRKDGYKSNQVTVHAYVKEDLEEGIDKSHPIVKEYDSLKKHDIKTLRGMIGQHHKVVDTSEFKTKDHAISHLLRQKHGNKKVDHAFGFNEEVEIEESFRKWQIQQNLGKSKKEFLSPPNTVGGMATKRIHHNEKHDIEVYHGMQVYKTTPHYVFHKDKLVHMTTSRDNAMNHAEKLGKKLDKEENKSVKEEVQVEESNNTPYVKPHIEKGSTNQSGWKASNKHGRVKYFGMDFKKSAEKHAGLDESIDEGVKEKIKGVIRREKAKELPLLQTRRDYAHGKAGDAYNKGDTKTGDRYMNWREKSLKKDGLPSSRVKEDMDEACDCTEKEREDVVNVARPATKKSVLTKQGEIEKKIIESSQVLDESFNIAFASGVGVTLTAADLGMKAQGGFALHPSVIAEMEERELEEDAKSALKKPVYMPPRRRADGSYGPAKTVLRKTGKKIIDNTPQIDADSDPHDGQ